MQERRRRTRTLVRRVWICGLVLLSSLWVQSPAWGQRGERARPIPMPMSEEPSHASSPAGTPEPRGSHDAEIPADAEILYWTDEDGNYFYPEQHGGARGGNLILNAEYLLIRPHFSEAIAFARGQQTLGATFVQDTAAEELDFSYDPSLRVSLGYQAPSAGAELRFTYTSLEGDVNVDGAPAAGGFLVDPFGNAAGTLVVIDPHSALAGVALPAGDFIRTRATVNTDTYDVALLKTTRDPCDCGWLTYSVGARIAEVDQFYSSTVTLANNFFAGGDFSVDYLGAGPRIGAIGHRRIGSTQSVTLMASGHASLLVGQYEVLFNNRTSGAPAFDVSQNENLVRLIPVLEIELGAEWHLSECWSVGAGWMFQSWFDFGASGGHFGGFFQGADDSNIMSFDGLFAKVEARF